ncbi:hypothetical protein [Burkholderia anthina]|uniref:hypothetical protein n=1 Tax=Burkholderia anthina TaxID=179879 RepID=UPI00158937B4|nr:hypothetical protein [Burkholderia anthina]
MATAKGQAYAPSDSRTTSSCRLFAGSAHRIATTRTPEGSRRSLSSARTRLRGRLGLLATQGGTAKVDPSPGIYFDTLISALKADELGLGVALARSSPAEQMRANGQLIAPLLPHLPIQEAFWLVYSPPLLSSRPDNRGYGQPGPA